MNLPEGYPHGLGFEWIMPYRYQRIREVLDSRKRFTLDDMVALQMDTRSVTARRVVSLLAGLRSDEPEVQKALALLGGWNGSLDRSSGPAALYEIWFHRHLVPAAMAHWMSDEKTRAALLDEDELYDVFEGGSAEVWISRLEDPRSWQGAKPREERRQVLLASLGAAIAETERLLGSDWDAWAWGRLHQARLEHPLSTLLDARERAEVDVGPAPRGGSGATVNSTAYSLQDFVQRYGASYRMVLDVGDWDRSVAMNSPGQSGDPSSPHYRDLFDPWSRDETFPLLFSRERVEAVATHRIVLRPAPPVAGGEDRRDAGP
jgi:penicillin amidase